MQVLVGVSQKSMNVSRQQEEGEELAEATNEQNAGAEDLCDEAAISCNASESC